MNVRQIFKQRQAVFRALKIGASDPHAHFSTDRFTVLTIDGKAWIAGAVSASPIIGHRYGDWFPNGGEVILWNPRTNEVKLRDDDHPTLILPHRAEARLTVYADGFAFFRAWADNRAAISERINLATDNHRITHAEPSDGGIPGALAIGALNSIDWTDTGSNILVAGPGIDPKKLNSAIIRSAKLPRVESLAA